MIIPVILSGGAGTRLWPISRESHPKPFMKLPDGQSLIQKTFARAAALEGVSEVLTITNREYYFKSRDEYQLSQHDRHLPAGAVRAQYRSGDCAGCTARSGSTWR